MPRGLNRFSVTNSPLHRPRLESAESPLFDQLGVASPGGFEADFAAV
jgi:hypothetical protein